MARSTRECLSSLFPGHQIAVGVPSSMAYQGHCHYQADVEGDNADTDEHGNQRGPQKHRPPVLGYRPHARRHSGHHVGLTVHEHRGGDGTDGEGEKETEEFLAKLSDWLIGEISTFRFWRTERWLLARTRWRKHELLREIGMLLLYILFAS